MEYNSKKEPINFSSNCQFCDSSGLIDDFLSVEQEEANKPKKNASNIDLYFLIGLGGLCITVALIILSQVTAIS